MDIINRINIKLAEIGKSGAEMSRDLGLSNSIYSQWNTGKAKPSKRTLSRIAPYLKTTVEYLLTGENEKPATISDDGFSEVDEVFRKLSPENREKLLELACLYLDAQHNQ